MGLVAKEPLMHLKTRDLLAHSWQSQANLSFFLLLLVVLMFVFPAMGFEKSHLPIYADIAFTVASVVGAAIALGEPNPVRASVLSVRRSDCGSVGDAMEPDKSAHAVASIDRAGSYTNDYGCVALAGLPLGPDHGDARSRCDCCLFVPWFRLGTRLPHCSIVGSWCFRRCGGAMFRA